MRVLLLSLFFFAQSALAFQTLTCKTASDTGLQECAFYVISAPTAVGWQEMSVPYASLVPAGVTKQIRVTFSSLNPWINQPNNTGGHTLLIESPGDSGKWDVPLCWIKDGFGTCKTAFSPGLLMAPGDELCLQSGSGNGNVPSQVSYAIHFIILP